MTIQFEEPMNRTERDPAQAHREFGREATVASVWLIMYVLIIGAAVVLPTVSQSIEVAAR